MTQMGSLRRGADREGVLALVAEGNLLLPPTLAFGLYPGLALSDTVAHALAFGTGFAFALGNALLLARVAGSLGFALGAFSRSSSSSGLYTSLLSEALPALPGSFSNLLSSLRERFSSLDLSGEVCSGAVFSSLVGSVSAGLLSRGVLPAPVAFSSPPKTPSWAAVTPAKAKGEDCEDPCAAHAVLPSRRNVAKLLSAGDRESFSEKPWRG